MLCNLDDTHLSLLHGATTALCRKQEAGRLLREVATAAPPNQAVNLSACISSYVADSPVRAIVGSRFQDRADFFWLMEKGMGSSSSRARACRTCTHRRAWRIGDARQRSARQDEAGAVETIAFMDSVIQELLRIHRDGELEFPHRDRRKFII